MPCPERLVAQAAPELACTAVLCVRTASDQSRLTSLHAGPGWGRVRTSEGEGGGVACPGEPGQRMQSAVLGQ